MSNTTRAPSTRKTVPGMGRDLPARPHLLDCGPTVMGRSIEISTHSVNENDATQAPEETVPRDRQPAIRGAARRASDVRDPGEGHRAAPRICGASA